MKLNEWSVVKTPIGLSLKHMPKGKQTSRAEVCVSHADTGVNISVYVDGFDAPYFNMTLPFETINVVQMPRPRAGKRGRK